MATQVIFQQRGGELNRLVRRWDRRLRLQQVFTWLPRCLLPGLLIGITLAVISRLRPFLLSEQILALTGSLLVAGVVVMLVSVVLWPRSSLAAARRFDLIFGLQERVSTALELIAGRIHANDELVLLQVDDAWAKAQGVRAADALPLVWRWREWLVALLLALVLALLLIIPNPQEAAITQDSAQQAAIDAAAEQLRQITETIAADAALEPEAREELLQALEASRNVLEQPNITPEEAFASLADAEATLQEQAQQLEQQAGAAQASLQAASDALRDFQPADQQQDGAQGAAAALESLSQSIPTLSQQQQQNTAAQLQQSFQQLLQTNPALAESLRQAAEALQNGDTTSAQTAIDQASADMQQAQEAQQGQQASAQQLSQSAQSVQQSANQVSQQAQQGQQSPQSQQNQQANQAGQQGDQGQEGQQGQPNQSGQPSGQQGDEGQQGQSGQPQSGQSGQQPSNQAGQQGQGGQAGEGGEQGQGSQTGQTTTGLGPQGAGQTSEDSPSSSGSGAGDSPGDAGQEGQGQASQGGPVPQDNNPDGQGEGQFDPVYAPQRVGGQSSQQIQLDADAGNAPVQEGEFAQNPAGDVTVPYNQVFSDYSTAANRALESDYIPLALRDVVRDYFSSLEPGSGQRR